MASGIGESVIDFGEFPGSNQVIVSVTGQSLITTESHVEAFFMAETTSDHTPADHAFADTLVDLTCGVPIAGTGFSIYATSWQKMQGTFKVRWVWTD